MKKLMRGVVVLFLAVMAVLALPPVRKTVERPRNTISIRCWWMLLSGQKAVLIRGQRPVPMHGV